MTEFLVAERRTLKANLAGLLANHRGEFVLVHGDRVEGVFPTEDDALGDGYRRFGVAGIFLVQQIAEHNRVAVLTPFVSG